MTIHTQMLLNDITMVIVAVGVSYFAYKIVRLLSSGPLFDENDLSRDILKNDNPGLYKATKKARKLKRAKV